jgi:RNA polymerase sigma factor (sigma-70 family)
MRTYTFRLRQRAYEKSELEEGKRDSTSLFSGLPNDGPLTIEGENVFFAAKDIQTVVLYNMREGFYYAKSIVKARLSDGEVFSFVYSALLKAAKNYDPSKNQRFEKSRFFGYAKPYLRGEAFKAMNIDIVFHGFHHLPAEISEEGSDEQDGGRKLDSAVDTSPSGDSYYYAEGKVIPIVEPDFEGIDIRERWDTIKPVLKVLNENERMVLDLHYWGGFNFQKIGNMVGLTRSAIQYTHSCALKKVRAYLSDESKNKTNR